MRWEDHSGGFLAFSSFVNALVFILPAGVVLGLLVYFNVTTKFWLPVMLIYAIGAISQQLCYEIGAINIQIQLSSEYTVNELTRRLPQTSQRTPSPL